MRPAWPSKRGIPVLMDAGGRDAPIPAELLRLLTVLSPNETELARLAGTPVTSQPEMAAAAQALMRTGVEQILIKRGAQGCTLFTSAGALSVPAIAVRVVDTTGAGDCFTAAYAVAMLEDMPVSAGLAFACTAAALCVTKKGALPSMPTRREVDRLLARTRRG